MRPMLEINGLDRRCISADFSRAKFHHHSASRPLPVMGEEEVACCLTIYNEPSAALLVSMAALMRNIRFLLGEPTASGAKALTLCIIADGARALAPSTRQTLINLGLFDKNQGKEIADLRVYERTVTSDRVEALLGQVDLSDRENRNWLSIHQDSLREPGGADNASPPDQQSTVSLRVLACIKKENAGKLNSHCWFFNVLCPAFRPKYCLQMDAGTAPKPSAIHRLIGSLERDQHIGAVASMIMVHSTSDTGRLLHLWQYGDFALQKLLEWPAEMLCGYLTVIPGQFCVFRWSALSCVVPHEDDGQAPPTPQWRPSAPLDQYFRGMNPLGPFESNMFLAEDRILGFEILAQQNSRWKLHYENTAVAITDSCDSIAELFRQRRRWTNSTFTCNLWLITKVGTYLRNSAAPAKEKLRTFFAVPWLCLNMAFQWFLPALVLLYFKQFVEAVGLRAGLSSPYFLAANAAYFSFIGLLLLQVILFVFRPSRVAEPVFIVFAGLQSTLFVCSLAFTHGLLFVAFCVESAAALLFALAYSRGLFAKFFQVIIPYTVMRPAMMLSINLYSLCNLHNCSWGTKGLLSTPGFFTPQSPARPNPIDDEFYRFRNGVLVSWLLTNALGIWAWHGVPPERLAWPLQIVSVFLLVLFGIKLVAGLLAALQIGTRKEKAD